MKSIVIIPARLASRRLPGKLLLAKTGKPLILHTIEAAKKYFDVIVATEDKAIAAAVSEHTQVIVTPHCASGSERVRVAYTQAGLDHDVVINWQADEPELDGRIVQDMLRHCNNCDIVTLATPATDEEFLSPNVVKVVVDNDSSAMYFSRASIPYNGPQQSLRHLGVYVFTKESLSLLSVLDDTSYQSESLEQLRWLQAGLRIKVCVVLVDTIGIDTREEYEIFVRRHIQ